MLQSRYITKDDFKEYFGIDLEIRLNKDDNPSNTVNAFLIRVEDAIERFLYKRNPQNIIARLYPEFSDFQKEHYKKALLIQAKYQYDNGDIGGDSGYDQALGVVANKQYLDAIKINTDAVDELEMCGLLTRNIKNTGGDFGGWWY